MHTASSDSSRRLRALEEILAATTVTNGAAGPGDPDPVEAQLVIPPLDRIRRVTSELQRRADGDIDEIDAVTMRLLLSDYTMAVGHLRAAARLTEQRMTAATVPIEHARAVVPEQLRVEHSKSEARVASSASPRT